MLATASLGALDAARSVVFMGAIPAASAYKTAEKIAEVARDSALFARDDKGVITDEAYVALIMLSNALGYSVPGAPSRALLPELLFGREGCIWICRPNYKFTAAAKNLGKSTDLVRDTDISEEEKRRVLANASGIVQRPWAAEMWFSARIQVEKSTSLVIRSVASMTAEGKHPRTDEGKFAAIIDQDALRLGLVEVQEVLYSSEAALLQMAAEVAGWEQGNPKSKHALTAALAQLEALNLCYPAVEEAKLRIKAAQLEAEKEEAAQVEAGEEERAPGRSGVSAIGGEYLPEGGNVAAEEGGYEADGGDSGAEGAEADGGGSGAEDAEAAPVSRPFIHPFIRPPVRSITPVHSFDHSSIHPSTHLPIHPSIHSFIDSFIHSPIHPCYLSFLLPFSLAFHVPPSTHPPPRSASAAGHQRGAVSLPGCWRPLRRRWGRGMVGATAAIRTVVGATAAIRHHWGRRSHGKSQTVVRRMHMSSPRTQTPQVLLCGGSHFRAQHAGEPPSGFLWGACTSHLMGGRTRNCQSGAGGCMGATAMTMRIRVVL